MPAATPPLPRRGILIGVGVGALAACTPGGQASPRPATASIPAATADSLDPAILALLRDQAAAVLARQPAAYQGTLADRRSTGGQAALAVYDVLTALPLAEYAVDAVTPAGQGGLGAVGAGSQVVRVDGRYRLAGYDAGPTTFTWYAALARRAEGWAVLGRVAGRGVDQVWDLPGTKVVSSTRSLVVGDLNAQGLHALADRLDAATHLVAGRFPDLARQGWTGRVVGVAPATSAQWQRLTGATDAGTDPIAALTAGPVDASTGRALADRLTVQPEAFAGLQPAGRDVVLRHETTHAALRAAVDGTVPLWVSEGVAELVGYTGVRLPDRQLLAPLADWIRGHGLPDRLPDDAAFAVTGGVAAAYNQSWIAAGLLQERVGGDGLLRFYRAAATPPGSTQEEVVAAVDRACASVLGLSLAEFTTQWRARVRARLAG